MRRAWIAIVLAASLTGCGDSPEHKLSLAHQFMKTNQPDKALEMAEAVLAADIKSEAAAKMKEDARFIKAQAYLALNQLVASRQVLDEIKNEKPNDPEPARWLISWAKKSMAVASGKSEFETSLELQKQFDDAMNLGESMADLLASKHKRYAESEWVRADLIMQDVNRYRNQLEAEKKKSERRQFTEGENVDDSVLRRYQSNIDNRSAEVEKHLANVLKEDPTHAQAAGLYMTLLANPARGGWKEVLEVAQPMVGKELSASLAQQVVMAVLRVPESFMKKAQRLDLADQLLEKVVPDEQKSSAYLLTRAHQMLSRGEKDDASQSLTFLDAVQPSNNNELMEKNFLTAWCLFQQGKYTRAKLIMDTLEVQAGGSLQVLTLHAEILLALDDLTRAEEQIGRALAIDDNYLPAQQVHSKIFAKKNKGGELFNRAKESFAKKPEDLFANQTLINHFIGSNAKEELERHLQRVENVVKPLQDEHLALLIEGFNHLGRHEKTVSYARQLKDRRPDQFATHMKYAQALMAAGRADESAQYLESIKGKFPEAGTGDLVLAQLRLSQQQLPEALALFQRYVILNPGNIEAKLGLARTLASMERIEEAEKQLNDVLMLDDKNQQANAILARIKLFQGDTDAAGKFISQIDENDVDENVNPALKAQILIQKDKLPQARDVCNNAVVRGNNDPVLRLLLARIYTIEKKPADAEIHLLALAYAQPRNLQVYRLLGEFYEANKELQTVGENKLKDLQKVSDVYARLALAGVVESRGKPDEALYILSEILPSLIEKKNPDAFEVANGMARIHLRKKEVEKARNVFKSLQDAGLMVKESRLRQIDLSWANPSVHYTSTQLTELGKDLTPEDEQMRSQVIARLAKLEKREQALITIDEWIKATPDDATLYRWKGEMLGQMGRYTDSVEAYRQAIGKDPKKLGLHARLVSAHLQNFDFPAAETQLNILGAIDAKAKALSLAELGQIYVRLGLNRQAAKTFAELEKLGAVNEPTIMFAMGKAFNAIGMKKEALDRLDKVPTFARLYPAAQVELARIEMRSTPSLETQARDRIRNMINDARTRARCMTELLTLNPFDKENGPLDSRLMQFADEVLMANAAYSDLIPRQLQSQWMRIRVILLDRNAKNNADYEILLAALDDWQRMEPSSIQIFKGRIAVLARMEQQPKARQLFKTVPQLATTPQGPLMAVVVGLPAEKVDQRAALPEYFVSLAEGKPLAAKAAAEALETRTAIYKKDMLSVIDRKDVTGDTMRAAARQLATAVVALDAGLPHLSASLSQNVIKVLPDLVPAHSLLAQAQLSQGLPLIDTLAAAQKSIPSAGITYYLAAETKIDAGDYASAATDLTRLLEAEPNNIHARYRLTQVHQLAGQHEMSIQLLEKMHADGGPYRVMVANDLAYLLATHAPDRMNEAQDIAQRAQKLVEAQGGNALGAAALLDTIGWIELMKGNAPTAISHLCKAVAALNDRAEVHYHVALAYDKMGNREWAKYHMEQAANGDKKLTEVTQAKDTLAKWSK